MKKNFKSVNIIYYSIGVKTKKIADCIIDKSKISSIKSYNIMEDRDSIKFNPDEFYIFLCPTYGNSELPLDMEDYILSLRSSKQDIHYCVCETGFYDGKRVHRYDIAMHFTFILSRKNFIRSFKDLYVDVMPFDQSYLTSWVHDLDAFIENKVKFCDDFEKVARISKYLAFPPRYDIDKHGKCTKLSFVERNYSSLLRRVDKQDKQKVLDIIGEMENLEHLDLSYSRIEELSVDFTNNKKLKFLNLDSNYLNDISNSGIYGLKDLEHLSVIANGLNNIDGVGNLSKLKYLGLAKNGVSELPSDIVKCQNLEVFLSYFNKMQEIPQEILALPAMKIFNFGVSPISELPEEMRKWSKTLESLHVFITDIEKIPSWIGEFESLKYMIIIKNKIKSLPEEFCNMKNLTELRAYGNQIEKLPDNFHKLENLKYCNFGKNKFNKVPKSLQEMPNLEKFIFHNNDCLESLSEQKGFNEEVHPVTWYDSQVRTGY